MRCVSVSLVKNEADVIEAMVRHNVQYLDHMTIIDNGSSDGTFEILTALRDEGLPIDLRRDLSVGHMQKVIMNRFLRSRGCDRRAFVFFLDGDEFLCCDRVVFREAVAARPASFRIAWKTHVPTPADDLTDPNVITRITMTRQDVVPPQAKAVLSPVDAGPVVVRAGCHAVHGLDLPMHPEIRLAHFPVRSVQQIASKALLGAWNVQLRGRKANEAAQWFQIAERIRTRGLPTPAELQEIAATYATRRPAQVARDPLLSPVPFDLRYLHMGRDPLLSGLVDFVDGLVARVAAGPAGEGSPVEGS